MNKLLRVCFGTCFWLCASNLAHAQYCLPDFVVGCSYTSSVAATYYSDIDYLKLIGELSTALADIGTGCTSGEYVDRTHISVTLYQGSAYTGLINSNGIQPTNTQVYIDFNDDSIFQASESVGGANNIAFSPATGPFNIFIPDTAVLGSHRIRFIVTDSADAAFPFISPCAVSGSTDYTYGQVNDYSVLIAAPPCMAPDSVNVNGITTTKAVIGGISIDSISLEYIYVLDTIDSASLVPSLPGSTTTTMPLVFTGLTPGTNYYFFVRDSCDSGSLSSWVKISFTTLTPCYPPSSLVADLTSDTSALIVWNPDSTSAGVIYQYVIDTNAADPPGSGINTTDTFAIIPGLLPAYTYYAHVRDSCGPGNFSAWFAIPFTTTLCPTPVAITANMLTDTSAAISWQTGGVFPGAGFQYIINTSSANPLTSGIPTADSSVNSSSLIPATVYYVHVRDSCGPGYFSAWVTDTFTTQPLGIGTVIQPGFSLTAAPNPATKTVIVYIKGSDHQNAKALLTGITGKTLNSIQVVDSSFEMELENLPSGIYLLRYTDSKYTQTIKINKE